MRDWIAGIVGENMATAASLVLVTLAIVFAFLLLFAIFKAFSGSGVRNIKRTRQPRLTVMDAAIVDSRRRLVLIRRDDVEHLLLIGGPTDVVVEQNITRLQMANPSKTQHPRSQPAMARQNAQPVQDNAAQVAQRAQPVQPAARAQAPARTAAPAAAKSGPVPSPQIRPATTPPVQPAATAASVPNQAANRVPPPSKEMGRTESELRSTTTLPGALHGSAKEPAATSVRAPMQPSAPPAPLQPAGKPSSRGPVLAKASASTVAAAVAPIVAAADDKPAAPKSNFSESGADKGDPKSGSIVENQLSDFEDNLAMNLGETLVPDELMPVEKDSLASEMDELLSEITASSKS